MSSDRGAEVYCFAFGFSHQHQPPCEDAPSGTCSNCGAVVDRADWSGHHWTHHKALGSTTYGPVL